MHARIDKLADPSWAIRIWAGDNPSSDRAYCAVVVVSGAPPDAYLSTTMARGRWSKELRVALNDALWTAGYRGHPFWYGFRNGEYVERRIGIELRPPKHGA